MRDNRRLLPNKHRNENIIEYNRREKKAAPQQAQEREYNRM
jgi:hypothetical protein